MLLTSENELTQHYFLSSRTLHYELSVIGLFMNPYVFLEHFLSWFVLLYL